MGDKKWGTFLLRKTAKFPDYENFEENSWQSLLKEKIWQCRRHVRPFRTKPLWTGKLHICIGKGKNCLENLLDDFVIWFVVHQKYTVTLFYFLRTLKLLNNNYVIYPFITTLDWGVQKTSFWLKSFIRINK